MAMPAHNPAPKLESTRVPPPDLAAATDEIHEEGLIDEAIDESFPASDPSTVVQPSGTLAVKHIAEDGRECPGTEPDPAKEHLEPSKG